MRILCCIIGRRRHVQRLKEVLDNVLGVHDARQSGDEEIRPFERCTVCPAFSGLKYERHCVFLLACPVAPTFLFVELESVRILACGWNIAGELLYFAPFLDGWIALLIYATGMGKKMPKCNLFGRRFQRKLGA